MACQSYTLAGIESGCRGDNLSGVKYVLFANKDDIASIALDASGETITGITMSGSTTFKKYEFAKETGSLTSEFTADDTAGVAYWTNTLALQFNKLETSKRVEIIALANNEMVAIVADANGKFWFLGYNEAVTMNAGTLQTGAARGDGNFANLTFDDISQQPPFEVNADVIETII